MKDVCAKHLALRSFVCSLLFLNKVTSREVNIFDIYYIETNQNFSWDSLWETEMQGYWVFLGGIWLWLLEDNLENLPNLTCSCIICER